MSDAFAGSSSLLAAWLASLAATTAIALVGAVFPVAANRLGRGFLATAAAAPFAVLVLFAVRGFTTIDRPVSHWVFARENPVSLRFGATLDPIAWITAACFGIALVAISLRNRPGVRAAAAAAGAWAGLCLVASAKTGWTALLGVALQVVSNTLPLLAGAGEERVGFEYDSRWAASTRRTWIGAACFLAGATGLATLGVRMDFHFEQSWVRLDSDIAAIVAGGLVVLGLTVLLTSALTARANQTAPVPGDESGLELRHFAFEGSIAWSALLIAYRLHGPMQGSVWAFVLSIGCAVAAGISLPSLLYHDRRGSAGAQWWTAFAALLGALLPMVPAQEAFLTLASGTAIASGLLVCFVSPRGKLCAGFSIFFMLGATGMAGWSVSAGLARLFTGIEEAPIYRGILALIWLLYASVGWRLALRREHGRDEPAKAASSVALGLLALIAFGPLLSGRWSGGSVPDLLDWILAARNWPWLDRYTAAPAETSWVGFWASQGIWPLALLIGAFAWRSSRLFPFVERSRRAWEVVSGGFGALWAYERLAAGLSAAGHAWESRVSAPFWEKAMPRAAHAMWRALSAAGSRTERWSDPLTGTAYGAPFRAPAKLVRWFHGGNARLYGWFALIWILIFSIYLSRS